MEKNQADAEKNFKEVIKIAPKHPIGYTRLGFLYHSQKQREKALTEFAKALKLAPGLREALYHTVSIYLEQKKSDTALKFCDRQSKLLKKDSPSRAFIFDLKGRIYLAGKNLSQAKKNFEKAIAIDSNSVSSYEALARISITQKDIDAAIAKYKEVLNKRPSYLPAYVSLGSLYQGKGEIKEAESYFRRALEIKNDLVPAANNLAFILAEHGGNLDEALTLAQMAKEKMPNDPSIMDTLGWIYYKKGLYRNALVELEESHEKMQKNPEVLYHLGMTYMKNGQHHKAKAALQKALKLGKEFPGRREAEEALADLG